MKRLAIVLLLMLFAGVAEAGVEARWAFTFADPDGRLTYVYRILLVSGTLEPGSAHSQHVTLYDVPRLIPDSPSTLPDWVASVQTTGIDADDIPLNGRDDAPKLLNVTWSWNGTAPIVAPHDFGLVSFDITSGGTTAMRLFVGQSTGPLDTSRALIGRTRGPQP
ncbi:MAG: hypothetical protein M3P06_07065 [Acidobacteriota bacterium]|nr:hypothetical protein [Acidobacteriota bacterium]